MWVFLSARPEMVLSSCYHPDCLQSFAMCTLIGKQWSLAEVSVGALFWYLLLCCLLSAEPGLIGVVDKEQKMNNLYFTLSQRLLPGLLSRKNIPGLQSQRESMCQAQPIVPLFNCLRYYPDRNIRQLGLIIAFLFWFLGKENAFYHPWAKPHFRVFSCCQNDPDGR